MKQPVSTLLATVFLLGDLAGALPLTQDFGQEREFDKVILTDQELLHYDLNSYFRGHFLNFTVTSEDPQLQKAVRIQEPVVKKQTIKLREKYSQVTNTLELQMTLAGEDGDAIYFLYLDEELTLQVLQIEDDSLTANKQFKNITQEAGAAQYGIYDAKYISQLKSCAHLMHSEDGQKVFVFCHSASPVQLYATLVTIDLSNIRKPIIGYQSTTIPFEDLVSGQLRVFTSDSQKMDLILFPTRISSSFSVYRVKYRESITVLLDRISSLSYRPSSLNDRVDNVTDLAISDIKEYSHMKSARLLISDYRRGLFVADMSCAAEGGCRVKVQSLLKRFKIDKIEQAMKSYTRVIVAVNTPPQIIEIDIADPANPLIHRFISLTTDREEYFSLGVIDSNEQYIIIQMIRVQDLTPIIRVLNRMGPFKSFAIKEIDYNAQYNPGHYLQFIGDNHFVLKTSTDIMLLGIQNQQLILDGREISTLSVKPNSTLEFNLSVSDYLGNTQSLPLTLIYLPSTSQISDVFTSYPAFSAQPLLLPYSCGMFNTLENSTSYHLYRLDSLFSGPKNRDFVFHPADNSSNVLLQAKNPRYLSRPQSQLDLFDLGSCRQTALVKFLRHGTQTDAQLMCLDRKGYAISFYDVIVERGQGIKLPGFSKEVQGGREPKDYIFDQRMQQIFVVFWQDTRLDIEMFKMFNVLAWMRKETIPSYITQEFSSYRYAGSSFSKNTSLGLLMFEKDLQVALLVFKLKDLSTYERPSFELLSSDIFELGIQVRSIQNNHGFFRLLLTNGTVLQYTLSQTSSGSFKYLIRRTLSFDIKSKTDVLSIDGHQNMILSFSGKNTIQVHYIDDSGFDILNTITLPMSLIQSYQERYQQTLEFVKTSQCVIYALENNYLFVIYRDTQDADTFYVIAYDISTWRHNIIVLDMVEVEGLVPGDPLGSDLSIHLYSPSEKFDDGEVMLIIQTSTDLIKYRLNLYPVIELSQENARQLDQLCLEAPSQRVEINYTLCSDGKVSGQCVPIHFVAENHGLLIKDRGDHNVTIVISEVKDPFEYQNQLKDAAIVQKQLFTGFNMLYDYRLLEEESDTDFSFAYQDSKQVNRAHNLKMHDLKTYRRNLSVEFISTQNNLVDYFPMQEVVVTLDHAGAFSVIDDLESLTYEQVRSEEILGCRPNLYTYYQPPYLLYQCNFTKEGSDQNQISIGLTLLNETSEINGDEQYYQFNRSLLKVRKTVPHLEIAAKIKQCKIAIHPNGTLTLVLQYDIEDDVHQSVILTYDLDPSTNQVSDLKYLSPQVCGFNSFKVTDLALYDGSLLLIAVEDFGLVIYSLETQTVLKEISIKDEMRGLRRFRIQNIVVQDHWNVYLVMNRLGVIRANIGEGYVFETKQHYNFMVNEVAIGSQVGMHPSGFAFLTKESKDGTQDQIFRVRFFSYYDQQRTKMLGGREFQEGAYCDKLKSVERGSKMIRSFESQNGENEMWNSFICGADFYFIDFAVSINLYVAHEDKPKFTKLRQLVEMTATNAFSKESVIIELITLNPSTQTLDAMIWFSLFIIVMVFSILCLTQNWTTKIKLPESSKKRGKGSLWDGNNSLKSMQTMTTDQDTNQSFSLRRQGTSAEELLPEEESAQNATTATFKRQSSTPSQRQLTDKFKRSQQLSKGLIIDPTQAAENSSSSSDSD